MYIPNYQEITVKGELKLQNRYFTGTENFLKTVEGRLLYQNETDPLVMKQKFGGNRRIRVLDSTSSFAPVRKPMPGTGDGSF